jgi:DNA topoisomerase-1
MNRKQYRYHPLWEKLRSKTKFYRMLELGKVLPEVRKQVQKDLSLPGIPQKKVLAAIVSLMEKTGIRIGNDFYEKLYGSFGLTTLKDKHVSIKGEKVKFCFRGKKGVDHEISLRSKKLARIVKQCRDIPGKELFQYVDGDGKRQVVDSGMVNDYIRSIADNEFTAKDLRTWCGSITALSALLKTGIADTQKATKQKMLEVLDEVSGLLGNTRTVCKKYYVHPCLFDLYENGKLADWVDKVSRNGKPVENLAAEEVLFIKILEGL